jgi:Zn-dependent peptidase ImmA (M78 family)
MARSVAFVSLAPSLIRKPWYERPGKARHLLTNEDWREWQANQFAGELLMPEQAVRDAVREFFGEDQFTVTDQNERELADELARTSVDDEFGVATSLSDRFDVNPQAMAIRLLSLRIVEKDPAS